MRTRRATGKLAVWTFVPMLGCARPVVPATHGDLAGCETAVLANPTSGPTDFDTFNASYVDAPSNEREALATQFVSQHSMPLIAPDGTVVLLYIAKSDVHDVRVIGDFRSKSFSQIGWDPTGVPMRPITPGSPIWFVRMRFATDARLDYQLVVDGVASPDPLNPHAIDSGMAASGPSDLGHASELVMPSFHRSLLRSDVPHGTSTVVAETWAKPEITIYLPPGYDRQRRYRVIYTADGHAWQTNLELPATLDALIAARAARVNESDTALA